MRPITNIRAVIALTAILACSTGAQADPIVVGSPGDNGNCFPFGCGAELSGGFPPSTRYQQVYNSSNFAVPIVIREIEFYQSTFPHVRGGALDIGTYQFYLSTTARPVNGLDTSNFASNLGPDNSSFATMVLFGSIAPDVLAVSGTPFLYDPRAGNLLLDIVIPGGARHMGRPAFYDSRAGTAGNLFSRATDFGGGTSGYGLVTGFNGPGAPAPTPEPASVLLVGGGLALIARSRRRLRLARV